MRLRRADTAAVGRFGSFIERTQPKLAVSGHIHEVIGTDTLGSTVLVNPGPAKQGRYVQIDLDGDIGRVRFF